MNVMTHDSLPATRLSAGLGVALVSAASFGMSGALARGLLDSGWSAGAAVAVRVLGAFLVLAIPATVAMRGRWHLVRHNFGVIVSYGVFAVATAQWAYFNAVQHMSVGASLLMEYTAPVAVMGWLWIAHRDRPTVTTLAGAALAVLGLTVVIDLWSGAEVSTLGVSWGLLAMAGAAVYFVLSAKPIDLPPIALAAGGMLVGGLGLVVLGAVGLIEMSFATEPTTYRGVEVPYYLPLAGLVLITAAIAYTTGIVAARLLGARVASFVALTEVLAAISWAWLLIGEVPSLAQLVGGVMIIGGVIVVKLGERQPIKVKARPKALAG